MHTQHTHTHTHTHFHEHLLWKIEEKEEKVLKKSIKSTSFIYYFFGTKNIFHFFTEAMLSC